MLAWAVAVHAACASQKICPGPVGLPAGGCTQPQHSLRRCGWRRRRLDVAPSSDAQTLVERCSLLTRLLYACARAGTAAEMVCPGGELAFVLQMVAESEELQDRVHWCVQKQLQIGSGSACKNAGLCAKQGAFGTS